MSDIQNRVKAIIVDKLGVDESEVKPEATFTNDLGAGLFGYGRVDHGIGKRIQHHYSGRSSRENRYRGRCYCIR